VLPFPIPGALGVLHRILIGHGNAAHPLHRADGHVVVLKGGAQPAQNAGDGKKVVDAEVVDDNKK
jgi:hypothetical protein